jgi:hypothetical protein
VVGPPGPIGRHCPMPPWRFSAPPGANLAPYHVSDLWKHLFNQQEALIQVSLINDHDGEATDRWAHCHGLGASPTDFPFEFHHVLS